MQSEKSLAEITLKALILGVVLSMVLAAANAYLGLFAGMTVSASIPAAVLSMGILRLFRKSNILENNIVQTAASAGESLAAGVIFTLPGLIILGQWKEFNYWWVTAIAGFGGILGVLFTIPLRRSLIVEGKLQFPEGIATAEVLETGETGGGIVHIVKASVVGGLFKVGAEAFGFWPAAIEGARSVGGSILYFGSNLSPALLSVGYIVGLNIAVLIFLGGAANWLVAIPICASMGSQPEGMEVVEWANKIWSGQTRYIGVGGMLVGGLWTIFKMRKSLLSGITSGLSAYRNITSAGEKEVDRTEKDMPMKWVMMLIVGSVVPLFLMYQFFVGQVTVSLPMAIIMLITGFVFSAVAGYMAGLVGSSNNPISGVTIATVLVSSLLLLMLMGKEAPNGPAAAIIIGSVVCCAAAIAGDNMQDLKAGRIVGATPWKQQVMQLVGTVSGAIVIAPVLMLLHKAYGFVGQPGQVGEKALMAAQANLMASVARGVFSGNLPWNFVFIGMGVAALIIICDIALEIRQSSFRMPVLAVAIGIYLPLELSVPIFAGGLIHYVLQRRYKADSLDTETIGRCSRNGLLFASGLITGEALMGIIMAIPIVILAKMDKTLPIWHMRYGGYVGTIVLLGVAYWLYATARRQD